MVRLRTHYMTLAEVGREVHKAMTKAVKGWRYRSAITGRYCTAEYARLHPKTTVRERVAK